MKLGLQMTLYKLQVQEKSLTVYASLTMLTEPRFSLNAINTDQPLSNTEGISSNSMIPAKPFDHLSTMVTTPFSLSGV